MVKLLVAAFIFICTIIVLIFGFRIAFPLPKANHFKATYHLPPAWGTELGSIVERAVNLHPDQSGIRPLTNGKDAFAARALLARAAEVSIDAQYYIWHEDATGIMLLDELRAAADRGVRVRLLVDDNGIHGFDEMLAALDAMPNAEVRIFNPFTLRKPKLLSYLFDFRRLNRRMHNKSITFDGFATIVGGRNVGDIYFEYGKGVHFVDVDVLAIGNIVGDISKSFDDYWNSEAVYAASLIIGSKPTDAKIIRKAAEAARDTVKGAGYEKAIDEIELTQRIRARDLPFEWTNVQLFVDPPTKGLGTATDESLIVQKLVSLAHETQKSLDMVSAYFIPGDLGMEVFSQTAKRGVSIRVLTNSLEATDVPPVYGAYMRQRPEMLDIGMKLLELRAAEQEHRERSLPELLSGSASSLHAKVISLDRNRAFVGSYNLDPRSAWLNCEMGLLIDSPEIARWISETLDKPTFAYEVERSDNGKTQWIERAAPGLNIQHFAEPNIGAFNRTAVWLSSYLPIRWML